MADKELVRNIYECLPKLDCGLCGHMNCGHFARAVAEGKASPFGCQQNPRAGYQIARILGMEVREPASSQRFSRYETAQTRPPASTASVRQEIESLSTRVDSLLARIDRLASRY